MNKKNSYKDYKYVYTGYKDYCKDHKIETEKKHVNTNNQSINHDHRFKFDFNNPTQHTHDYSFDFNNPNEHYHDYSFDFSKNPQPKNNSANKKTNYTNTYNNDRTVKSTTARPMATTARTTSTAARTTTSYSTTNRYTNTSNNGTRYTTINTYKTTNKNSQQATKMIKFFFFMFFIFPFIISFLSIFFTAFDSDYDDDYETDYKVNINYDDIDSSTYEYDQYTTAVSSLCSAIRTKNFEFMRDRITYEELMQDNGIYWQNIINSYSTDARSITCSPYINEELTISRRNSLENEFYNEYYERIDLTEAKQVTITVRYYDQTGMSRSKNHTVYLGRINNKWYFINTI